jgi:hypothetical protein
LTGIGTVGNNGVSAGSSYGLFVEHPPPRRSPSPLLGVRNDRLSIGSPSVNRRMKGHRAIVGKPLLRKCTDKHFTKKSGEDSPTEKSAIGRFHI